METAKVEKAKETQPVVKEVATSAVQSAPHRPQSRNFKAEREARAKEQAAKRSQGQGKGGQAKSGQDRRDNRQQGQGRSNNERNDRRDNRRDQRPEERKDNRFGERRDNRANRRQDNRSGQSARFEQREAAKPAGPKIDFKARAAALKAEQNAEYARTSEERFRQAQEAKSNLRSQKKLSLKNRLWKANHL